MKFDKWYPVKTENVEILKNIFFDFEFELTFNSDYSKIKKTNWQNNKPI